MYGGDVAAIFGLPLFIAVLMFWFSSTEGR